MVNPTSDSGNVVRNTTNMLLQMNDDSTSSRMTKLDIEHSEDTLNSNNENDRDSSDNNGDTDMDDLPPLSTYLAGWKFWFQFAVWPFVFLMLNGVIVSTLVTFDEYEFQYGKRRHSHMYYEISVDENRNSRIPYEMLKYNRMIIAVLLLVDAFIIYRAILFLDKKVRELDMIGDVNHDESNVFSAPSPSHGLKPNVHAQVSRKLDTVLGRNPQSRISILVSILWLLFVGCGTVGLVSVADLLFAISPKGKQVCMGKASSTSSSSNYNSNNDDIGPHDGNYNNTKPIENIPDELQEWARTRHDMYSYASKLVHLTNGVTFFAASDPSENRTRNDRSIEYMYGGPKIQLVSIGIGGNITFHKNAINPNTFTSLSGENLLDSTGFCCLYRPVVDRQNSRSTNNDDIDDGMIYQEQDVSILCTQSSDTVVDGVFRNMTLYKTTRNRGIQENFDTASMKLYNQEIWVQLITSSYNERNGVFKTMMTFYTVSFDANTLVLKKIAESSMSPYGEEEFNNGPFFIGSGSPCYKWTRNIDVTVFVIVLGAACAWLIKIKNLSVGIVPGVVAVSMMLSHINHDLGLAMSSLSTVAVFLGLLGCVRIPLSREKMIWAMYTLLLCVAGLIFTGRFYYYYDSFYNFERALVTITIASLMGFILNHPVLYLFGWVGGIWAIICGIFLLFTPPYGGPNYHTGIFALGLGIIVGSGCATIGFNLIKYRAHVVYYSKRAWFAMNAAMQSNNTNHRVGRNNPSSSSTATRYAPVMHIPPTPTVNTENRDYGENDITAGLLNQNVEGRTRSH